MNNAGIQWAETNQYELNLLTRSIISFLISNLESISITFVVVKQWVIIYLSINLFDTLNYKFIIVLSHKQNEKEKIDSLV